ncbi:MAG: alpha/beta fold hydrolase, partial [Bacteroidota bacterium]
MKKVLSIILWIVLGVLLVAYLFFRFGMNFTKSDEEIAAKFANQAHQPAFRTYQVNGFEMHYADMGADTLPTLIFIHGSPGTWDAYLNYFLDPSLVGKYRMIAMDRIGYGKSDPGKAQSELQVQADLIAPLLATVPKEVPLIIVGHSFGGPVCIKLAMDHPHRIDGMMLLAGLADPVHEKRVYWLQTPFTHKALRWLLPPDMDVSNREILPLKGELKLIEDDWSTIQARTIVMQGGKDMLVAPPHADFVEAKLGHVPLEMVELPEENHFI